MKHRRNAWTVALTVLVLLAIGLWYSLVRRDRWVSYSLQGEDFGLSVPRPLRSAALSRDGRSLLLCSDSGFDIYDVTKSPAVLRSRTPLKLTVVTYSALLNDELVGLQDQETLLIVSGKTNEVLVREHCVSIPNQIWLAGDDRVVVMYSGHLASFKVSDARIAPVAESIQLPPGNSVGFGSHLANVAAGKIHLYSLTGPSLTHLSTIPSGKHYVDCVLDTSSQFLAATDGSTTSFFSIKDPQRPVAVPGSEHFSPGDFLGFYQPDRVAYRRSSVTLGFRPSHRIYIPCSPFTSKRFCTFDADHSLNSVGFLSNGDFLYLDTRKRLLRFSPPTP